MAKDVLKKVEYRGFTINIYSDDFNESPRDWDNVGTMTCWHNRYDLGDEQGRKKYGDPEQFLAEIGNINLDSKKYEKLSGRELINALLEQVEKDHVIMPLYLYDHSGLSMSTSNAGYPFNCRWDSGQVGWIWVNKKKMLHEWGKEGGRLTPKIREKAMHYLRGEVNTYDQYLRGEIYGYMIEDADGEETGGCWGFYGWDNEKSGLLEAARDEVDAMIKEARKSHFDLLKTWIRNKVPTYVRTPLEPQFAL